MLHMYKGVNLGVNLSFFCFKISCFVSHQSSRIVWRRIRREECAVYKPVASSSSLLLVALGI